MRALQLISHGAPGRFQIADLPALQPAADEVVVKVRACGLNRLDLWLEEGGLPIPLQLPRTPGAEIAGVIAKLGSDVDEWRVGDRVAIQSNLFCGHCEFCLRGDESICLKGQLLGVQKDGGFAEEVLVPARSLVAIPAAVDFETSAALTLAGSTAMHMLTNRAEIRSADWVLVMGGASGVGTAAIQISKQLGANVIATASTLEKRNVAMQVGADHVIDSTAEDWPNEVRQITDRRGVDIVVEHIGGRMLQQAFACLARGGTVVTCGATAGRDIQMNLWPFFVKQQRLIGSYGRNRADMIATLDWAAVGKLKPMIHRTYKLAEAPQAFAELRARTVLGKAVVVI
ncbi:MAG TPA: zinc-binding dehydrogenase [Verrucomicrobiae bacterium]|nr:zinc-binding dehydrogenase [Verrucomicrobiae bacterium]